MPGKVDLYNLGSVGVDLTKSKIHADDGSLLSSQNAVPDVRGEAGGLTKRDGLIAINSSTAGGSITGALDIPLPAPAITSAAARRTLYIGGTRTNGSNLAVWWPSYGGTYPTLVPAAHSESANFPNPPLYSYSVFTALQQSGRVLNGRFATVWDNKLYYAADAELDGGFTSGLNSPHIRVFKTTDIDTAASCNDRLFAQVPVNPDVAANSVTIVHMMTEGSYIYLTTHDAGSAFASHKGSVYRMDPKTGAFLKLGATFPTGYVPYCLTWWLGRLWAGTYSEDSAASGRVYFIRPGIDSTWTLDHTTTAGQGEIFALAAYKGELYAATGGSSGAAGLVKKRTTTGTWSTSQTGAGTGANQWYSSLVVFGTNLYAAYRNATGSANSIEKFDGSSWSSVETTNPGAPWQLETDNIRIFAIEMGAAGTGTYLHSTSGTSWTTIDMTPHNVQSSFGVLLE